MTKTLYEIDTDGFMTYQSMEFEGEKLPKGYVDVPLPMDEKGNQLPFWKPKWNGMKWIEARPQEEIDAEKNALKEPTELELLRLETAQANAEMFEMLLMMTGGTL